MFFLIRSAVCIGVVAVLATGGDRTGMGRFIDGGGREAVQSLGRACIASNDCLQLGMGLVGTIDRTGLAKTAMPTRRSHDTLTASDLAPAWSAMGGRRADIATHLHPGQLARL